MPASDVSTLTLVRAPPATTTATAPPVTTAGTVASAPAPQPSTATTTTRAPVTTASTRTPAHRMWLFKKAKSAATATLATWAPSARLAAASAGRRKAATTAIRVPTTAALRPRAAWQRRTRRRAQTATRARRTRAAAPAHVRAARPRPATTAIHAPATTARPPAQERTAAGILPGKRTAWTAATASHAPLATSASLGIRPANAPAAHQTTPPAPFRPRPRPSQPSATSLGRQIPTVNREISSEFKLICPVRTRLRQPADPQVPQLCCPILDRQLVKERFAGVLVDAVHLDR